MKRLSILVVEDDGIVAFLLGELLESMGYDVSGIVSNEAGARASAKRCRPDLMIVDENLGLESGLAVMDAILLDGPMPHVFVSGDTSRIRAQKPLAVVLEKPYFETDLEQAIWRALARPRDASQLNLVPQPAGGPAPAGLADGRRT